MPTTTRRRPRVAFLTSHAPYPPPLIGAQIRVHQLIRALSEDVDILLVALEPSDKEAADSEWELRSRVERILSLQRPDRSSVADPLWGPWSALGRATVQSFTARNRPPFFNSLWSEPLIRQLRALTAELPVDAAWATRSWMGEMAKAAGIGRIIVDVDDFEGELMVERLRDGPPYRRKPLHQIQARSLLRYERSLRKRFDALCICKDEDRRLLDAGPAAVHVVPNGVEIPANPRARPHRPGNILFVGTLWYQPNIDSLTHFVSSVLPRIRTEVPQAGLTVAGRGPVSDELRALLERAGAALHESPATLDAFYDAAAISVAPLQTGGGTSIKVLESLAHAVPTVATPTAVRGLGLAAGTHLAVAESAEDFAAACVGLLRDPERGLALGRGGREEVARRFSWDFAGANARAALRQLLGDRATGD